MAQQPEERNPDQTFDEQGRPVSEILRNEDGTVKGNRTLSYEGNSELPNYELHEFNDGTRQEYFVQYDENNNPTSARFAANGVDTMTFAYQYDEAGRQTEEIQNVLDENGNIAESQKRTLNEDGQVTARNLTRDGQLEMVQFYYHDDDGRVEGWSIHDAEANPIMGETYIPSDKENVYFEVEPFDMVNGERVTGESYELNDVENARNFGSNRLRDPESELFGLYPDMLHAELGREKFVMEDAQEASHEDVANQIVRDEAEEEKDEDENDNDANRIVQTGPSQTAQQEKDEQNAGVEQEQQEAAAGADIPPVENTNTQDATTPPEVVGTLTNLLDENDGLYDENEEEQDNAQRQQGAPVNTVSSGERTDEPLTTDMTEIYQIYCRIADERPDYGIEGVRLPNPQTGPVHVDTETGSRVDDSGMRVVVNEPKGKSTPDNEMAMLVTAAFDKGWTAVNVEGTKEFQENLARTCVLMGMPVKGAKLVSAEKMAAYEAEKLALDGNPQPTQTEENSIAPGGPVVDSPVAENDTETPVVDTPVPENTANENTAEDDTIYTEVELTQLNEEERAQGTQTETQNGPILLDAPATENTTTENTANDDTIYTEVELTQLNEEEREQGNQTETQSGALLLDAPATENTANENTADEDEIYTAYDLDAQNEANVTAEDLGLGHVNIPPEKLDNGQLIYAKGEENTADEDIITTEYEHDLLKEEERNAQTQTTENETAGTEKKAISLDSKSYDLDAERKALDEKEKALLKKEKELKKEAAQVNKDRTNAERRIKYSAKKKEELQGLRKKLKEEQKKDANSGKQLSDSTYENNGNTSYVSSNTADSAHQEVHVSIRMLNKLGKDGK